MIIAFVTFLFIIFSLNIGIMVLPVFDYLPYTVNQIKENTKILEE